MRNSVIGLIIGVVLGIVLGATVIAPRLERTPRGQAASAPAPTELARQLPRALVSPPAVSWKMASAFAPDVPIAGPLAARIDNRVWEVSRGQVEVRAYPPGALAPVASLFESVGSGAIDAALATPGVAGDPIPALALYAGIPFGPPADEFLAWLQFGGGQDLLDDITGARNVHAIPCGLLPPAAFGWFRQEIIAPQDLKDLRMDARGLAARILDRLGVTVVDLPPGDLMLGLEQGTIDGLVFASPAIDQRMGFATWLKIYYPQGWGASPTLVQLLVNLKRWTQLNAAQQALLETVCGDAVRTTLSEGEAIQYRALKDLVTQNVQLHRLSPSLLEAMDRGWQQVVQHMVGADPDFRRTWQSLAAFRAEYAVWRELSRR